VARNYKPDGEACSALLARCSPPLATPQPDAEASDRCPAGTALRLTPGFRPVFAVARVLQTGSTICRNRLKPLKRFLVVAIRRTPG
jgi:hypothetical protein